MFHNFVREVGSVGTPELLKMFDFQTFSMISSVEGEAWISMIFYDFRTRFCILTRVWVSTCSTENNALCDIQKTVCIDTYTGTIADKHIEYFFN